MALTAISKMVNASMGIMIIIILIALWLIIAPLNKANSKCPAIIFAAKRTANVKGRIILLINSISTINGVRALGVLNGTKWANVDWGLREKAFIICPSHRGRDNVKAKERCLDAVKI